MTPRHWDKGRFEVLAGGALDEETKSGHGTNLRFHRIRRIRAFQGHAASLKVLDQDRNTTVEQWALDDDWTPSYVITPDAGSAPYRATAFDLMPKMAYYHHATYNSLFNKTGSVGLIPGGNMTKKANSGRPLVMMAPEPQWKSATSQGVRPGAQVEFVIDLQVAGCDGCRFFIPKAGAIQVSNRAIYAYDSSNTGNCVGQ
ncbi:unnamed protein product [Symbiodinium sp. KB8]|nr:unnamed protein product [Symbiodinium sp. KB8]